MSHVTSDVRAQRLPDDDGDDEGVDNGTGSSSLDAKALS